MTPREAVALFDAAVAHLVAAPVPAYDRTPAEHRYRLRGDERVDLQRTEVYEATKPLVAECRDDRQLLHRIAEADLTEAVVAAWHRRRDTRELDAAVDAYRAVVDGVMFLGNVEDVLAGLARRLAAEFIATTHIALADAARRVGRDAVWDTAILRASRADRLSVLGDAAFAAFDLTGDGSALAEAIGAHRAALALAPDEPAAIAAVVADLAHEFDVTGDDSALTEADQLLRRQTRDADQIAVARAEIALRRFRLTSGERELDEVLQNLPAETSWPLRGRALTLLFHRHRRNADFDAALRAWRRAHDLARGPVAAARALAGFGEALVAFFDHTGDSGALTAALDAHRRAARLSPPNARERPAHLAALGLAAQRAFERTGEMSHVDESITAYRTGLAARSLTPAGWRELTGGLAVALYQRFRARDAALLDLTEALLLADRLVAEVPPGHPDHARIRESLGDLVGERDRLRRVSRGLDPVAPVRESHSPNGSGALDMLASALREGDDADPVRAERLTRLAIGLIGRGDLDPAAATLARAALETAARNPTAAPRIRGLASQHWAKLAEAAHDLDSAGEAYRLTVTMLPALVTEVSERGDQEHALLPFAGLASNAATGALRRGEGAAAAIDLLEKGRGVLLARARRTGPASGPAPGGTQNEGTQSQGTQNEGTQNEGTQNEGAQNEGTLDRLDEAQLTALAEAGPIVAINLSPNGSHALTITAGGTGVVELPALTAEDVADRAAALGIALEILNDAAQAEEDRWAAGRFLGELLRWLWDVLAEPVLDRLGLLGPLATDDDVLPRLWWMPTGMLSFLPLHAAGHHDRQDGRAVLDRVVSSYTPTLRELQRARQFAAARTFTPDPFVVAVSRTADLPELPGAAAEATMLGRLFPRANVFTDAAATRSAVLAALPYAATAHFACHAVSRVDQPSAAHLALADGPLAVSHIGEQRLPSAYLAFLSACATARGSAHLADEVIHVSSAFQLAGFPHVIGTLWPIVDRTAGRITEDVYTALAASPGPADPARALHAAIRRLRDEYRGNRPMLWAAHVHHGA